MNHHLIQSTIEMHALLQLARSVFTESEWDVFASCIANSIERVENSQAAAKQSAVNPSQFTPGGRFYCEEE
jgi:hypothetical protein